VIQGNIRNLIFDLGGVILDLHFDRTHDAFARAALRPVEEIRELLNTTAFFNEYEKGLISDEEFRRDVRELLKINMSDTEIDKAWSAMLGKIPVERLQLLQRLKADFRVFLLSNTNAIHVRCFDGIVKSVLQDSSLADFFEVAYYSNELKMRKPDKEIFLHVLHQHQLAPEQTLFLDDNVSNLEGAAAAGIKTFHVEHPAMILSLFS